MNKRGIRRKAFNFLYEYGEKVKAKFDNICAKTGQYDVPSRLFQKRTNRKNRVLIPWKTVKENNLTIDQLNSFSGGVVVEFVNNDFFDPNNQQDILFIKLRDLLGSNGNVSSIISIRSDAGSSSSSLQRESFNKLTNNTRVKYQGTDVTITKDNYINYKLEQLESGGCGNDKWKGFLFVSIKGGQQDVTESHTKNITLFNPACEFATEDVCLDIDLVMSYFALKSIDINELDSSRLETHIKLIDDIEQVLKTCEYENSSFTGNLYDYCTKHPSIKLVSGELTDPIQAKRIKIENFSIDDKKNPLSIDFTHDEAVSFDRFYWDSKKNCILSPARPSNLFWGLHESNMMQQDHTLAEYIELETKRVETRYDIKIDRSRKKF